MVRPEPTRYGLTRRLPGHGFIYLPLSEARLLYTVDDRREDPPGKVYPNVSFLERYAFRRYYGVTPTVLDGDVNSDNSLLCSVAGKNSRPFEFSSVSYSTVPGGKFYSCTHSIARKVHCLIESVKR